ncbi:MAG: DUF2934 domain-containing protein [Alphaproteobacteria bacterium]|nr:DUF2934 domain-containing protein [Alphaproteobacteria bacterium]
MTKNYNENYIREAAYYNWQNAGCPSGQDEYFWNQAICQLYGSNSSCGCSKSSSSKSCSTKSSSCSTKSSSCSSKKSSSSSSSSSKSKK